MGKCFAQNVRKRIKLGKVVPNIIMKSINKMLKPLVRFAIEFSKTNEAEIITIAFIEDRALNIDNLAIRVRHHKNLLLNNAI